MPPLSRPSRALTGLRLPKRMNVWQTTLGHMSRKPTACVDQLNLVVRMLKAPVILTGFKTNTNDPTKDEHIVSILRHLEGKEIDVIEASILILHSCMHGGAASFINDVEIDVKKAYAMCLLLKNTKGRQLWLISWNRPMRRPVTPKVCSVYFWNYCHATTQDTLQHSPEFRSTW